MNDLTITVQGWIATPPQLHVSKTNSDFLTFRLATTSRYYDRGEGKWIDRPTQWFTVRVFRAAAVLAHRSLAKGQPVVVVGHFRTNDWESNNGTKTDLVIDAQTIGHDLTRGIADFHRATVDAETQKVKDLNPPPAQDDEEAEEAEAVDVSGLPEAVDDDEVEAEQDDKELAAAPF